MQILAILQNLNFLNNMNSELAIDNIYHQPSKSEMMITPKEREEVPRAFKRLQQGNFV